MRRGRKIKYSIALLLALLTSFLCGCAALGDLLYDAVNSTEAPKLTEAPSLPTPDAYFPEGVNPVFAFISGFTDLFRSDTEGLLDSVLARETPEMSSVYMQLMSDEAALVKLMATIGMLPLDENTGAYSGTVTGVYSGQGKLQKNGSFTFVPDSGGQIAGSLSDRLLLKCTFTEPESSMIVERSASGYLAWITREGMTGVIELTMGGLRYTRASSKKISEQDISGGYFPTDAGSPVLTFSGKNAELSE